MTASFFGGAPSLSWSVPNPDPNSPQRWLDNESLRGVWVGGVVIAIGQPQQQTEMSTGKPQWWQEPNPATGQQGRAKMNVALTLRCNGEGGGRDLRNPQNPTDLGDRVLYVPDYGDLNKAIQAAFRTAGDDDVHVGATLLVAWLGYRPSKRQNQNPARTFAGHYVMRPAGMAQHGPQQPAAPQAPVTPPAAPATPLAYVAPTTQAPAAPYQPPAPPQPAYAPPAPTYPAPAQQPQPVAAYAGPGPAGIPDPFGGQVLPPQQAPTAVAPPPPPAAPVQQSQAPAPPPAAAVVPNPYG